MLLTRPSRTRGARSGRRCGSGSNGEDRGADRSALSSTKALSIAHLARRDRTGSIELRTIDRDGCQYIGELGRIAVDGIASTWLDASEQTTMVGAFEAELAGWADRGSNGTRAGLPGG